jgi:hypothetical protein
VRLGRGGIWRDEGFLFTRNVRGLSPAVHSKYTFGGARDSLQVRSNVLTIGTDIAS